MSEVYAPADDNLAPGAYLGRVESVPGRLTVFTAEVTDWDAKLTDPDSGSEHIRVAEISGQRAEEDCRQFILDRYAGWKMGDEDND